MIQYSDNWRTYGTSEHDKPDWSGLAANQSSDMWQKCPVCEGGGNFPPYSAKARECHVCSGYGIISTITGLTPQA
jgi:DnaJ-class molecular chaperone